MDDCCTAKQLELTTLARHQGRVLKIAFLINFGMFWIELVYGWLSGSTALLADSLDMLGDAFIYAISLSILGKGPQWAARVAFIKGVIMTVFGLGVLVQVTRRFLSPDIPVAQTMGLIGIIALIANVACAALLLRHRNDDINMQSTWLCSRNDVISNLGVIAAAFAVSLTGSQFPDLIVGSIIAAIVLKSSFQVLDESRRSLLAQKPTRVQ